MKKILGIFLGLFLAGGLAACGTNKEAEKNNTNNDTKVEAESQDSEYVEYLKDVYGEDVTAEDLDIYDIYDLELEDLEQITDDEEIIEEFKHTGKDPLDAMYKEDDMVGFFINDDIDFDYYEINGYYTSEDMREDGTIDTDIMRREDVESDDETFDYNFSILSVTKINEEEENQLMFIGEQENNTGVRAGTSHDVDIIMRDIKEEVNGRMGGDSEGLTEDLEPEFDSEGWYAVPLESDEIPEDLEVTLERAWEVDSGGAGNDNEFIDFEFTLEGSEDIEEDESEDTSYNNGGEEEDNDSNINDSEEVAESDDGQIPRMFEGLEDQELMDAIYAELGEEEFNRQSTENGGEIDLEQFRGKEPQNKENWNTPQKEREEAEEVSEPEDSD